MVSTVVLYHFIYTLFFTILYHSMTLFTLFLANSFLYTFFLFGPLPVAWVGFHSFHLFPCHRYHLKKSKKHPYTCHHLRLMPNTVQVHHLRLSNLMISASLIPHVRKLSSLISTSLVPHLRKLSSLISTSLVPHLHMLSPMTVTSQLPRHLLVFTLMISASRVLLHLLKSNTRLKQHPLSHHRVLYLNRKLVSGKTKWSCSSRRDTL